MAIIDMGEARRNRNARNMSVMADPPKVYPLLHPGHRRLEVERLVYESLKTLSKVAGPEAVHHLGERLILQIASRITAECGRERALAILETVAAGMVEVAVPTDCEKCSR